LGDGGIIALNINSAAGAFALGAASNCVHVGGNTTCGTFTDVGAQNNDGFGSFNHRINDSPGFSNPYTTFTLAFTTANAVTNKTGNGGLLTPTTKGANISSHIAPGANTACTGYVADAGNNQSPNDNSACGTVTPEPNSLALLLASGLFGMFVVVGRRLTA
jgi:hypothetical protein